MRTTRLRIVPGGGREVLSPGPGGKGGVVTWYGGREVLSPGTRGREVLSPGTRGREGGVVTWSRGKGGRCCHLVLGGRREVLSTGPRGGGQGVREVLSPGPGGREGGVVNWSRGEGGRCCDLVAHPPPPRVEVTHTCENITFAHFATRAVNMNYFFAWGKEPGQIDRPSASMLSLTTLISIALSRLSVRGSRSNDFHVEKWLIIK